MKTQRIYLDTSVIGGCFDTEFQEWSEVLMDDFRRGRYIAVISEITAKEIEPAPDFVRELYSELLSLPVEVIDVDENALSLTQHYMTHSILSQRFMNDMLHIVLATIAEVDVLVSWNFIDISFDLIRFVCSTLSTWNKAINC